MRRLLLRVDTAAIWVLFADDDVVDAHQRGEHAHRGGEPKRAVSSDGKGEADDVGFARAPVAIENGGGTRRVYVSRPIGRNRNHSNSTQLSR